MEKMGTITPEELEQFMFELFSDCHSFFLNKLKPTLYPNINVKIVYQTEKFRQFERDESKESIEMEIPKNPATAFTVGNKFSQRLHVDAESLINLLPYGYPTFILDLAELFIHELLHCLYSCDKTEQEIHDMQCPLIEEFIGIELPEEIKKLKASDYYERKS